MDAALSLIPQSPPISASVRAFASGIVGHDRLSIVPIKPIEGAVPDDCFGVVQKLVDEKGGRRVVGWRFAEVPGLYYEAEYHSVWETSDGRLIDPNPAPPGMISTLFAEDPTRPYEGRQVLNKWLPISGHPAIEQLVQALEAEFELMNRGGRADQYAVALGAVEQQALASIQIAKMTAFRRLSEAASYRAGRNDPCPCGSRRKYKRCCAGAYQGR